MWAGLPIVWAIVAAAELAAASPGDAARLSPDQIALLSDRLQHGGSFKVRIQAALILGAGGGPAAAPALLQALQGDSEPQVRAAAALALADLEGALAAAPLAEALGDEDPFVRAQAGRALSALAARWGPALAAPLATALLVAPSRGLAAGLAILGQLGAAGADGLVRFLGNAAGGDRDALIAAFAALPPEDANRALRLGLVSGSFTQRVEAARLLGERRDASALPLLADAASDPTEVPEVQAAARTALGQLRGSIEEAREEAQLLRAPAVADKVRALVLLGAKGGAEAERACEAALREGSPLVQAYAIQALGEIGEPQALPALRALLESEKAAPLAGELRAAIRRIERATASSR